MKCMIKSTMAVMLVAAMVCSASAADSVLLSTSNYNPLEGTTIGRDSGQAAFAKAMYVWVSATTGDEIAPQTVGFTDIVINGVTNHVPNSSAGLSLAYNISAQTPFGTAPPSPNVITFTGASYYNPTLVGPSPTTSRWDSLTTASVTATSISDINAVVSSVALSNASPPAVTSSATAFRGLENVNAGSNVALTNGAGGSGIDPSSVTTGGISYFLLGELDLSVTAFGTAQLAITAGPEGIYQGATNKAGSYALDSKTISVVLNGDTNSDGKVNGQDTSNILNNFGALSGKTFAQGDISTYDGKVNGQDTSVLLNHFGQTLTPPGTGAFAGVPEPSSLILLGLGSLAMIAKVSRRRK